MHISVNPEIYGQRAETLLQDRGIITAEETVSDALERTVNSLVEIDTNLNGSYDRLFHERVILYTEMGIFVYGTPVLNGAGRDERVTAACTVLPLNVRQGLVDLEHFEQTSNAALRNSIGTGYDLSAVKEPDESLTLLNEILDRINCGLVENHKRPVASMATLRADHPRVLEFVRAKRNVDFSKWRLNISLFVTEDLFKKASSGEDWELKNVDGNVVDSIPAQQLLNAIAESAHYCGEPGILFKDRIDQDNPTPLWEYTSTAPCSEVAMAPGEACQFSYINLSKLITRNPDTEQHEFNEAIFADAVQAMTRLLDASIDQTINNRQVVDLPLVSSKRRLGVGITGFADMLMLLGISYDSPESYKLSQHISELLDYHSKRSSVDLAKTRGSFPSYPISRYTDDAWLRRKTIQNGVNAVGLDAWNNLYEEIGTFGIRNASTTSMPPTGTSSEIVESSKSLEPHFNLVDRDGFVIDIVRNVVSQRHPNHAEIVLGKIATSDDFILPEDMLDDFPYLKTARQLSPEVHLKIQAGFQTFLDDSVAKTINLPNQATADDVLELILSSYAKKLKGIAVFRDGCLEDRQVKL